MSTPPFDPSSVLPADLDLAALRGGSTTLTLADGTPVRLVYDFDSLATIEEQYRTLAGMGEAIKDAPFTHLPNVLAAGLLHTHNAALTSGVALRRRLNLSDMQTYTQVFATALTAAFGDLITMAGGGAGTDPQPGASTPPSHGDAGTEAPSSTSGSDPGTSGA